MRFDNQVVIVTGAGTGMGRAHALLLADRGAAVVVNDIRGAADVASEITAGGGHAVADTNDIAEPAGASALVQTALDSFGGLHGIVNNAGISIHAELLDITPELLDRTMRVNAYGPLFIAQVAWPHLQKSNGRIVMISSMAAVSGSAHLAHYASSKGALLAMTRALAAEGANAGIGVNAVLPTAFTSMMRDTDGVAGAARLRVRNMMAEDLSLDFSDDEGLESQSTAIVSSLVAWLLHPDCTAQGEFFRASTRWTRRATYVMSEGIISKGLTPEDIRDNFARINDMSVTETPPTSLTV
ncbi:short-chain dehydrogenase/reductase SDR (plasmid) [Rhodococcus sp. WAY2]|nr:short-chain dehydrogenase/reductase SDR [Rhodococcus sp. WAY2]